MRSVKIGVASVILLPTKTVIPLAATSSLHGTILCFITLTLTLSVNYTPSAQTGTFLGCNITGATPTFTDPGSENAFRGVTSSWLCACNYFIAIRWLGRIARFGSGRDSVGGPVVNGFVCNG